MTQRQRHRLLVIDDPLDPAPQPASSSASRDEQELRALYVRLPSREYDDLARATFELHASKRELVRALIRRYVDPHSQHGLEALRELLAVPNDAPQSPAWREG